MDDISINIEIPADHDGYILLQCQSCTEYFKIQPADYESDAVLELRCPNCGLISDNYYTEEVIELAVAMLKNYAMGAIFEKLKNIGNKSKNSALSFEIGQKSKDDYESPIKIIIDSMVIHRYLCCRRSAKIKPMQKITGSYCPFCGVKEFGTE